MKPIPLLVRSAAALSLALVTLFPAPLIQLNRAQSAQAIPGWTFEGNQAGAEFGLAVSAAGDVNGDGFMDVIIGAPYYQNGQEEEGRAYAFYGSAGGLSLTPGWVVESDQAYAYFGRGVSGAGDVNGDGYDDVLVGAMGYDHPEMQEGAAFLYYGATDGLRPAPAWMAESNHEGAGLGFSVSGAGDVNGDGYDDVIVGAERMMFGYINEGAAYVYYGSAKGLSPTPSWIARGGLPYAYLGSSVSGAGDVNCDGYADVIIGEPGYPIQAGSAGRVRVYYGGPGGLPAEPGWMVSSPNIFASFGYPVSSAGDVNGDGCADVLVSTMSLKNYENWEGAVMLYFGSRDGLNASPGWIAEGSQSQGLFGYSTSGAGDVNGDGVGDIIIGAPYIDGAETDEGRVMIYFGTGRGMHASPDRVIYGSQAFGELGYDVSSAGDVNGDGIDDVLIDQRLWSNPEKDEGQAQLYYGSEDPHLHIYLPGVLRH